MKKLFTLILIFGVSTSTLWSQEYSQKESPKVEHKQANFFLKTPPLRDMIKTLSPEEEDFYANAVAKDKKTTSDWSTISDHGIPETGGIDPVLQDYDGHRDGSGMLKANWQGQGGSFPPDPTGAAGPEHYVQAVNSTYRIYDKSGNPITGKYALHTLWPGSTSDGDPIVMYDRYADRWFISQFQTGSNEILIAVSETSDPLGSYFIYEWSFSSFPDYPKYAVWSNAYFMTANTSSYDCVAYEREKMLMGDPTASMITMYFPSMYQFFNSVAPAYAEGIWAPDSTEPGWAFAVQDDSWSGITEDHIKVLKITLDWDTPSNSEVVIHQELNTAAFNSVFTNTWDDITQQGTSQKLDAVAGIFMYRAQYRRFDGYNSILLVTTVDVNNANRAGVRWFELRENNDESWFIHQEGTFDPDDGNSRWMGNAAMDINGNIGLAYSIAGPTEYAGLRYTGRFSSDPLGEMTVQEQIAVEGTGAQTGGNRYGDYSQMTVDPTDDATFWFTGEFLGTSGSRRTQIFSFAMWELLGEEEKPKGNPFFNAYQPNPSQLTVIWKDLKDQTFDIRILDISGKLIATETNVDATLNKKIFEIPGNATGVYIIQLSGENTQLSDKIYLSK